MEEQHIERPLNNFTVNRESRPDPDPTRLTVDLLRREMQALREQVETNLLGHIRNIETRFGAMDQAIELLQVSTDRLPAAMDAKVNRLQELHAEKFSSIQTQFEGLDKLTDKMATASSTAIAAALQAQKEAVNQQNIAFDKATQKSEERFTKQMEQMSELIQTGTKALDDKITTGTKVSDEKISTLNDRLTRIESTKIGETGAHTQQGTSIQLMIGVIGAVVGIVGVAVAILLAFRP
jgi:hypothetical protein